MKDFFRQNGILLLVIAFLLSVLIGVLSFAMGGQADPLTNLVNTVISPVRGGVSAAADWLEGVYGYVFRYGEMEQELKGQGFARSHSSYLVNLFYVKGVQKLEITLVTGEVLPISQPKRKQFMEELTDYWGDLI